MSWQKKDGLKLGETSATAYRGDRGAEAYAHKGVVTGNPHAVTASEAGAEPAGAVATHAGGADVHPIAGVAGLTAALGLKADLVSGIVPTSQLPAFVDEVIEVANYAALPGTGAVNKLYVTLDDSKVYRWGGTVYVEVSSTIVLGTTSGTAYRGDHGLAAYNHSLLTVGNPHNLDSGDVGAEPAGAVAAHAGSATAHTVSNIVNLSATLALKADLVDGLVPASQLPSYVDDVVTVATFVDLPAVGESSKIYVTSDTNQTYRWSGSAYVLLSGSLALGETSSTAYRGDRGKTAYDHSQVVGNPHGSTAGDVGADPAGTASGLLATHASGADVHALAGVTGLVTALGSKADYEAVTSLPAIPVTAKLYRLTVADATVKVGPGLYTWLVGWVCLVSDAPYDLGNLSGAVTTAGLVPGAEYVATVTGAVTSWAVSFTQNGFVSLTLANAGTAAVAQPTATGRTAVKQKSTGWDDAGAAVANVLLQDNGTYLVASAAEWA